MYFVILNSDSGTFVYRYNHKEELIADLGSFDGYTFVNQPEANGLISSTSYWGEKGIIIKGEIVAPKSKKVVLEYDID